MEKTLCNPKLPDKTIYDLDFFDVSTPNELIEKLEDIRSYAQQIRVGIKEDVFHLPMSPIDVIRQLITQECFTDKKGVTRNIRF